MCRCLWNVECEMYPSLCLEYLQVAFEINFCPFSFFSHHALHLFLIYSSSFPVDLYFTVGAGVSCLCPTTTHIATSTNMDSSPSVSQRLARIAAWQAKQKKRDEGACNGKRQLRKGPSASMLVRDRSVTYCHCGSNLTLTLVKSVGKAGVRSV